MGAGHSVGEFASVVLRILIKAGTGPKAVSVLTWRVDTVLEAVGAVGGLHFVQNGLHRVTERSTGAKVERSEQLLDLGEHHLDGFRSGL
jgi:hypothetical protein